MKFRVLKLALNSEIQLIVIMHLKSRLVIKLYYPSIIYILIVLKFLFVIMFFYSVSRRPTLLKKILIPALGHQLLFIEEDWDYGIMEWELKLILETFLSIEATYDSKRDCS